MAVLLEGVPLDRVSTSMTINATAIILLALYATVARRHGTPLERLSGTVQNDILKEYVARGTFIYPPRPSLRLVTDVMAFCAREMPRWNSISVSGYHIREAGATAAQELAFTLAHACAYVQAAVESGLDADDVAQRISFFFSAHNDFLEEIAKFRAARRLWARLMRDRFGATTARAQQLRFHTQTAGSTLTAQQPDNNIVRVALQALSAVLGGTQSLHCNARDEALALPTEESATIALRTQQILLHETGVANTVDPVGGAYAIEVLTNQLEAEAGALLSAVDARGGALPAVESGYVQQQIHESAYRAQQAVDAGEAVVVGVNRFADASGRSIPSGLFRLGPEVEGRQIDRVRAVRAGRSERTWQRALADVDIAARGGANLVPPIIAACEAQATLGEIADALRRVFGEYRGE
jgi:methylmalonyl-CoA mutase N-terminal domain/subunit